MDNRIEQCLSPLPLSVGLTSRHATHALLERQMRMHRLPEVLRDSAGSNHPPFSHETSTLSSDRSLLANDLATTLERIA